MVITESTALFLVLPPIVLVFRVIYLVLFILNSECKLQKPDKSMRTLLCIGSGGHTTELLRLFKSLDCKKFQPRLYVAADNDRWSEEKICILENEISGAGYVLHKIPRSRNVHQSYVSSIASTLRATLSTVPVVYNFNPDVILCNGPGTCVPICVVAFLLRCMFLLDCRIIFVESICRVRTLSLTGKILQFFADIFVVQWPQLRDVSFRAKYFGRLT